MVAARGSAIPELCDYGMSFEFRSFSWQECQTILVNSSDIPAYEISVSQTLLLLRDELPGVVEAISAARYAFWLGSGISRTKLDNVPVLVLTILKHLQAKIDRSDASCAHRRPFQEAVSLAQLSKLEMESVNLDDDVESWEIIDAVVERISSHYSELLDIEVDGAERDYLLWEVLDVPGTYGKASVDPDLEHFCLAVLIMEGVAPEIVTANWDGLIEKAVAELSGGSASLLSVYVRSEDFREPLGRSRLLKFHGCAIRAIEEPDIYRTLLVGRRTQITDWPRDAEHKLMREAMASVATTRPTLMVGMSAQDSNIQDVFALAKENFAWNWPEDPPAFIFAEDELGINQKNILRVGYRSTYNGNEVEIAKSSLVRAFGKPLFASIVLSVLTSKLITYAGLANTNWHGQSLNELKAGLEELSESVAQSLDVDMVTAMRRFIADFGRAMTLLRSGIKPENSDVYAPLGAFPIHLIQDDPNARNGGVPEMAMALSILGNGVRDGSLRLSRVTPSVEEDRAVITMDSDGILSRIFFASTPSVAIQLVLGGLVKDDDWQTVVIHSSAVPATLQRRPSAAPGRTGLRESRHIDMADLISSTSSYEELCQGFREGLTA